MNISYITQIYKGKPYLQTLYTTVARWCIPLSGCFSLFLMFLIIPLSVDLMAFGLIQYLPRKVTMVVSYHSWIFSSHRSGSVCLHISFVGEQFLLMHIMLESESDTLNLCCSFSFSWICGIDKIKSSSTMNPVKHFSKT